MPEHDEITVTTATAHLPASKEQLADAWDAHDVLHSWLTATPEQRDEWRREAAAQRQAERDTVTPVALTLETLLDALDLSPAYAQHLVQPYCTCGDSPDGWYVCPHAHDLGLGHTSDQPQEARPC